MNNDLFIDLFAYRQRENKDPIEDWTTECLAATIRSLPSQVLSELLKEFTRADRDISVAVDAGEIEVLTQYHAGTRYLHRTVQAAGAILRLEFGFQNSIRGMTAKRSAVI